MSLPAFVLGPLSRPGAMLPAVLLALVFRLAPLAFIVGYLPRLVDAGIASDGEAFYLPLARNLAHVGEFTLQPGEPYAKHVPVYPLLLAGLEKLGALSPAWIASFQALLGTGTLVLLFIWVRQTIGPREGLVALGLAALLPDFAAYSYLNLSETLSAVFVLASLVGLQRALSSRGLAWWGVTGALLGVGALSREFCLTLIVPFAIWAIMTLGPRRAMPRVVLMVLLSGLTVLPWTVRNYRLFGELIPLSEKGGANLYLATLKGKYHPSDARRMWRLDDPRQEEVHHRLQQSLTGVQSPRERSRLFLNAAWRNISDDPWGQIAYIPRKALFFWQANIGIRHGRRIGLMPLMVLSEVFYWACLVGALVATATVVVHRRHLLGLWGLVAWIFLFHLFVGEAEPRYHYLALIPIFAIVASGLITWARGGHPETGSSTRRRVTSMGGEKYA